MKHPTNSLPSLLQVAQDDIERWRSNSGPRGRIPEEFWRRAVQLVDQYGLNEVAVAMRLSHKGLAARVDANQSRQQLAAAGFVELTTAVPSLPLSIENYTLTLQMHDGAGRKMLVTGADQHSAASVIRTFFGETAR